MFEPGMQVLCQKRGTWLIYDSYTREFVGVDLNGPKYNDIVTISYVTRRSGDRQYLCFEEHFGTWYNAKWFIPLIDDATLIKELESIDIAAEIDS